MTLKISLHLVFSSLMFAMLSGMGLSGCSTTGQIAESTQPTQGTSPKVEKNFEKLVENYSAGDSEYSGFYNNFEYKATLLNAPVREALLARQSAQYQWDREKLLTEKEKASQEMANETEVFLSFFTPDRQNDNLTDAKSIWRVYLDVAGRRYQGKPSRVRTLLAELQSLFPYHTRWNTPYSVSFPVPTSAIETQPSVLTITGPLGTRSISFKAVE